MLNDQKIFKHMRFVRGVTIKALETTTETLADEIPFGFKNSIRWNLGHIYVIHELLAYQFSGGNPSLPTNYNELFQRATSPLTWDSTPPTLTELSHYLLNQVDRLERDFADHIKEQALHTFKPTNEVEYNSIGEILNFAIWHEGNHLGTIKSIKRACGVEKLWELPDSN
jgi:hypothetical protein